MNKAKLLAEVAAVSHPYLHLLDAVKSALTDMEGLRPTECECDGATCPMCCDCKECVGIRWQTDAGPKLQAAFDKNKKIINDSALLMALKDFIHQVEINEFVDPIGHDLEKLVAYCDVRRLMEEIEKIRRN